MQGLAPAAQPSPSTPEASRLTPQQKARSVFLTVRQVIKNLGAEAFYAAAGKIVSLLGKRISQNGEMSS